MEEKQNKKNTETVWNRFAKWCKKHPKAVFMARFLLWTVFSAVLPFAFIAYRYGIFTVKSKIELSGWGIIAIIVAAVFTITLIKYLYRGLKPGLTKQCVVGAVKVIVPLAILYLVVVGIEKDISSFKQALSCVIICESVAIPLNPFPAWLEKRKKEQGKDDLETVADALWDKFFDKKKEKE